MARHIMTLFNLDPVASDEEIREAAAQYVRRISGFDKPSAANEAALARAVDEVAASTRTLIDSLVTKAPPRKRAAELPDYAMEDVASFGSGE